ncbi:hypothetical protein DESUT3_31020 [Desulfuromonas versatilis]|uniref:DUF3108 domain-containing protein n=1 Tax=Desulfuromonas versatilis TaxID=2802975 RepID=A0ABM8HVP5_9BACT|nr:hypothetical protein [Desulfuromonas versatilis]BCR06033.1 hypothetical protein DESUT3_31020 [Desulfuromonas versatilis]
MRYLAILLAVILALPAAAAAESGGAALEAVSQTYAATQPGLNTFQVTVQTSKFGRMLEQMTASMPANLPRPAQPVLKKYVSRELGASLIRAEGQNVFPYMQEMVGRLSAELAVDLRTLFLPLQEAEKRRQALGRAKVVSSETRLGDSRTLTVDIRFEAPADLHGAFYGAGLDLPQQGVAGLVFDLDPDSRILKRLEITLADGQLQVVELRHRLMEGGQVPREVHVTTPDGRIDDHLTTTFAEVKGFWLPVQQVRTIVRPGRNETITVSFSDYKLNAPLPAEVLQQMQVR